MILPTNIEYNMTSYFMLIASVDQFIHRLSSKEHSRQLGTEVIVDCG